MTEYKNIDDFCKQADGTINLIKDSELSVKEKINIVRTLYDKISLLDFIIIGNISQREQVVLGCITDKVKLSLETIIKNKLEHPEISLFDYKNICNYIKNPDYILYKQNRNIIYFKKNNKLYQFVIKTTKDKKENYLTTFHIGNDKQLRKDLKRYKKIKR